MLGIGPGLVIYRVIAKDRDTYLMIEITSILVIISDNTQGGKLFNTPCSRANTLRANSNRHTSLSLVVPLVLTMALTLALLLALVLVLPLFYNPTR